MKPIDPDRLAALLGQLQHRTDLTIDLPDYPPEVAARLLDVLERRPLNAAEQDAVARGQERLRRQLAPPPRMVEFLEDLGACLWGPVEGVLARFCVTAQEVLAETQASFCALAWDASPRRVATYGHFGKSPEPAASVTVPAIVFPSGGQARFDTHVVLANLRYLGEGRLAGSLHIPVALLDQVPHIDLGFGILQGKGAGAKPRSLRCNFRIAGAGTRSPSGLSVPLSLPFPANDAPEGRRTGLPLPQGTVERLYLFEGAL